MATKEINLARLQQLRTNARIDFAKELHAFLKDDVVNAYLENNEVTMHVFPNCESNLCMMNEASQTFYSIDTTDKSIQQVKDIFASCVFNGALEHPDVWVITDADLKSVLGDDIPVGSDNFQTLVAMLVFGENAAIRHEALKYDFEPEGVKF